MENDFLFQLFMPMIQEWLKSRNVEMSKDGIFVEAMTNNFLKWDKEAVLKLVQKMPLENALDHILDCAYSETASDIGQTNMGGE